jgi:hypothetical protein
MCHRSLHHYFPPPRHAQLTIEAVNYRTMPPAERLPPPPHIACSEAQRRYDACVKAGFRSFWAGVEAPDCEEPADLLRLCIAAAKRRRAEAAAASHREGK